MTKHSLYIPIKFVSSEERAPNYYNYGNNEHQKSHAIIYPMKIVIVVGNPTELI